MTTVQMFWHGKPLSPYELLCLQSFVDLGHTVHVYTYENQKIPPQFEVYDAAEIISFASYFDYTSTGGRKTASAFSNLFRYRLLYERGGWWVDTDVICLTRKIPNYDLFFAWEVSPKIIGSAVLFAPAGHPLMAACADAAIELIAETGAEFPWGTIGPRLLTSKIAAMGYTDDAYPSSVCYPLHHSEALSFLSPSAAESISGRTRDSVFVHLWNEVLMDENIDKTQRPAAGSFLGAVADRHSVAGWKSALSETFIEALVERNELRAETNKLRVLKEKTHRLRLDLKEKDDQLRDTSARLRQARLKCTNALAALKAIKSSRSWRITKPLRMVSNALFTAKRRRRGSAKV